MRLATPRLTPRYIATVDRQGYRFAGPVIELSPVQEAPIQPAPAVLPVPAVEDHASASVRNRRWLWTGVGLAVVLIVAALSSLLLHPRSPSRSSDEKTMLAILPFENMTGDAGQDYFSDGLTEEMIGQLGRLDPRRLGVIARTSVMRYQPKQVRLAQIGRELGVQYVLEGSVRRDSQKVRISAHLIQLKDQTELWSRQYDRELSAVLPLQSEIAQEVADEIALTLGNRHERTSTTSKTPASPKSYQAYDLYLKGRYFLNKRTAEGFQQAAEYFRQAIREDPNYALAHAGLADTYALMSTWHQVPQNEFMPKARAAALKALQLDENLAEAHTSLALIAESYDYDWQTAEKEYRRAIQIDPSYATAHQWYAECLSFQGRFEESLAESERARQLDPLSVIIATDHGAILYFSRQYDRAVEQFRVVLEMEPHFQRPHDMLIAAEVQQGKFSEALADIERWQRNVGDERWGWELQTYVYGRWGRQAEARYLFAKLKPLVRPSQPDAIPQLLLLYLAMDRKDYAALNENLKSL